MVLPGVDGQLMYPSCPPHPSPSPTMESRHYRLQALRTSSVVFFSIIQLPDFLQTWLWVEKLPTHNQQSLFAFDVDSTRLISLEIHPDGKLSLKSTAQEEPFIFSHALITRARWTHISLVHYTHKSHNPTIRPYNPFKSRKNVLNHVQVYLSMAFSAVD